MCQDEELMLLAAFQGATSRHSDLLVKLCSVESKLSHSEYIKLRAEVDVARIDREMARLRLEAFRAGRIWH